MPSLYALPISARNLEDVYADLLRPAKGQVIPVDVGTVTIDSLLQSMQQTAHSDDDYHHGETILEHVREVVQAAEDLNVESPIAKVQLLTALMHDIAKPVSHKIHPTTGKHQFSGHWITGINVARQIMERYTADLPVAEPIIDDVCYLVAHHHDIYHLVEAREHQKNRANPVKRVQYLTKFLRDGKDKDWRLPQMYRFMAADTISSRLHKERVEEGTPIFYDIQQYRQFEAEGKFNQNVDPTAKNAPFYEGVSARDQGESEDACPYRAGTIEHKRWMIGFNHQGDKS